MLRSARRISSTIGNPCGQAASAAVRLACATLRLGRQGLVKFGGALALAVDLVIPQVSENIRHSNAARGRLAVLAAAVAVEVRGRLAIFLELLLLAQAECVINAGCDILPKHIAIGHLADDGVNPLVGKDGFDRGLLFVKALVNELLQFRRRGLGRAETAGALGSSWRRWPDWPSPPRRGPA